MSKLQVVDTQTINRTPIEILLQVDEKGMTTAKKLYEFLELDITNYAHWCKRNIIQNTYAERNVDYCRFVFQDETPTGGKIERADYKLTIDFAKKLCMTSKSERGEQARNYFIKVEEKLREIATKPNQQSTEIAVNALPIEAIKAMLTYVEKHEYKIDDLEERVLAIEEQKTNEIFVGESGIITTQKKTQYERFNIYSATQIGAPFGLSGMMLNRLLYDFGLQYPYANGGGWLIAKKYKPFGFSKQVVRVLPQSKDRTPKEFTLGWTKKGVDHICRLLKENGYEQSSEVTNKLKARKPYSRRK